MPVRVINFDLRHPAQFGVSGQEIYAAALDMIEWADERGFAKVAFGEHHQAEDGYLPSPLVVAAAVGGRTKRIRVKISTMLGPLYDPIKLAEDVAVADLCLGGRLEPSFGVGYVKADFDAFGVDYHRRGDLLDELVPFLRRAWTGEPFEHHGTTIRVTPRPVQDPMPIRLAGSSRRAIERAARLGDGYNPPMPAFWRYYRTACLDLGQPDPGEYPVRGPIFLWVTTGDKRAAWERLAPHIRNQIDSYAQWTTTAYGRADGPFVPTQSVEDLSQGGAYQVLDPDEAVELAIGLGPDGELHLNPLLSGIDPSYAWEMLQTLDEHVFPNLPH